MTRIENKIKDKLNELSETVIYYRYVMFYKGKTAVVKYMIENSMEWLEDKGRLAYGKMTSLLNKR